MSKHVDASRTKRWAKLLSSFFAGQTLVQGFNLLTGFLLLRWMTTSAYAQYSVSFAFQTTLNMLVDLGFSGSIVALVGDRGHDPAVIGDYIRCARHYRGRLFLVIALVSAVAFPLVTWKQPWGFEVKAALWFAVAASVFFQGRILYGAPLLIHRRLKEYYRAGIAASVFRLVSAGAIHAAGALFGWTAACLSAVSIAIQGALYRRHSQDLVSEPDKPDLEKGREMRRYLAPLWPGTIVYALQGQITLAIITVLGKTQNIAEVAALGRLGQLFVLLGAANMVLIEPYIAKTPGAQLTRRFAVVLLCCAGLAAILVCVGFFWPDPLLWLIGPRYASTGPLIGLVMAAASVAYLTGVLFMMNTARKWTYWTTTGAQIAVILVCQAFWIATGRASTTAGIVTMSLAMASASLVINFTTSVFGLIRIRAQAE